VLIKKFIKQGNRENKGNRERERRKKERKKEREKERERKGRTSVGSSEAYISRCRSR
jgi:hypothetical protein